MGVAFGSPLSSANTNQAFIDANGDDIAVGIIQWQNANAVSGAFVTNTQREHNSAASFMGKTLNSVYNNLPVWVSNQRGTVSDTLKARIEAEDTAFHPSTGHTHDGTTGNGPKVSAPNIANTPLRGYVQQGTDLIGVTGTSTDVSTELTGKVESPNTTTEGVVTSNPNNKVLLRYASGADEDDQILDGSGNIVYGRVTFATPVWTLSYYSNIAGTETAYNFGGATDVRWYYQELYNPLNNPPVYSEFAFIPSDNATQDVVDASATQRGVVSTGTQTFAGVKTFNSNPILNALATGGVLFLDGAKAITQNITRLFWDNTNFRLGLLTGSPNTTLDVNGDFATRRSDVASAATINALATTTSYIKLTGSTATTINGIASGFDGKIINVYNGTNTTVTLTHQNGAASAGDRIITTNGLSVVLNSNGSVAFTYDSAQSRWVELTTIGSQTGPGDGNSLQWSNDMGTGATNLTENGIYVFSFSAGLTQDIKSMIYVPTSYQAGNQITLKSSYYSPSTTNNVLFQSTTTLIRNDTDAIDSTTNQRVSTNAAQTNVSPANAKRTLSLDLTSATGTINGVAVSANDILLVDVTRAADTDTADVKIINGSTEVKFTT